MTTPEAASQPESLDLDYDMWQGQFEFVGVNNNNNNNNNVNSNNNNINGKSTNGLSSHKLSDSLEDLNLSVRTARDFANNKPILFDEETFLSLNPNDFEDPISGPNSTLFIENQLNPFVDLTSTPEAQKLLQLNKETQLNNKLNSKPANNCIKIENIKNYKNKLISDFNDKSVINQQQQTNNNQQPTNKMNGIKAELCDNLNEQLELLQRQVTDLADTQNTVEDRTTRTKTEYAVLQARYHMLEEQLRESELRSEERIAEEQKRYRELLARVERETTLQDENCQIKIRTIEIEATSLREEAQRLRIQCDKQANDLHATEEKLEITREHLASLQQELNEAQLETKKCQEEKQTAEELMVELGKELERLRNERGPALPTTSPETLRLEELHQELEELRQKNKTIEEQNEELQAMVLTRGVEEGRHLLNGTLNSLAQELEEMSQAQDSVDSATLASLSQLQQAYQDKEEENQRLKHYIDTILLNIVENYPQLLEVKPSSPKKSTKISQ